ncbi:MAG: Hsp70 family protein [Oscillospiraceae bacterium]
MRVGIDLGTTNTVVSYIDENGIWKLLEFKRSGRRGQPYFLPSCLAFKNGTIIVGQPALDDSLEHPDMFLCDTKYDMGNNGVVYHLGNLNITPQGAAQYILNEVYRELSNQFPNETTFNAFVTVPARFGNEARQTTKSALMHSRFETDDCCLTDEPIAAAVAYSSLLQDDKLVLVVDIGGGTFDLSLLKTSIVGSATSANRLEPVAWNGELHLGGNDVDEILVKKMTEKFMKDGGKDLYAISGSVFPRQEETNASALIRSQAFPLKSQMYDTGKQASVFIPNLLDGIALDFSISKEEYLSEMADLTERFSNTLENLYQGSGYTFSDTDHVLVVGGMAHELSLLYLLEQMFGKQAVIVPKDSMTLVSKGAAICNSNQKLHIENKAYTSVGLLKNGRTDVVPIIKQGSVIQSGEIFRAEIFPDNPNATAVNVEIVEYFGEFSLKKCKTILIETIQLTRLPTTKKFWNVFFRSNPTKLTLNASFTEDKILKLTAVQEDGTATNIDVRLGGN